MSRSHPPSLLRLVERCAREECGVRPGDTLLVACSGGPDSMALLHALVVLRERLGVRVLGHGVDHGLRAVAAAELEQAQRLATTLGVPFGISRLEVAPGGNLQARARRARHQALQAAGRAAGATAIALGHTADDRAETVIMRLLRGAGPRGLAAMPARVEGEATGPLDARGAEADGDDDALRGTRPDGDAAPLPRVRPMIRARRADVLQHLQRHQVPSSADPSNDDPRFLRVRVRREVLPLLAELSPGIVAHLCALADMLGAGEPAAEARAAQVADAAGVAALGRAQREAIERARRGGRASALLRLRGGAEVTVSFPGSGIVVNPEGGSRRELATSRGLEGGPGLARGPHGRAAGAAPKRAKPSGQQMAGEGPQGALAVVEVREGESGAPPTSKSARPRKVPRSTAGGKGGMLVDSEKKGRAGATPGAVTARPEHRPTQGRPKQGPPRPPSRGSS